MANVAAGLFYSRHGRCGWRFGGCGCSHGCRSRSHRWCCSSRLERSWHGTLHSLCGRLCCSLFGALKSGLCHGLCGGRCCRCSCGLGERSHGSGHQCSGDQGIFEHHFFPSCARQQCHMDSTWRRLPELTLIFLNVTLCSSFEIQVYMLPCMALWFTCTHLEHLWLESAYSVGSFRDLCKRVYPKLLFRENLYDDLINSVGKHHDNSRFDRFGGHGLGHGGIFAPCGARGARF